MRYARRLVPARPVRPAAAARRCAVMRFVLTLCCMGLLGAASPPEYSIQAIRYADSVQDKVSELVIGAAPDERLDTVYLIWLVRGGGRNILFDSGFHRERWFKEWVVRDYLRPDEAVRLAGVTAEQITDVVISHAHWDHLGGIDLFPNAAVWIQKEEYRYYTQDAWQPGGNHDGIDPDDVRELVRLNTLGRLHLVDGDSVEIFPGITAYTGGRHTYAAQYLRIAGTPPFVLASDNTYLYRNLVERKPSATFGEADYAANVRNQQRMIELAGAIDRVVPGHDALQMQRFPAVGRVATLK
jgi:glyoxylase-like metal-dependent hydrolase (beta-lactamase superfamily II)